MKNLIAKRNELSQKREALEAKLHDLNKANMSEEENKAFEYAERELKVCLAEIKGINSAIESANAQVAKREMSKDARFLQMWREARKNGVQDYVLHREETTPTNAISSAVIQSGEKTNIESAGLPVTIKDIIKPLEMDTIYDKVGIQIATGVRGSLIWPCLDTLAEVSVAGETVALGDTALDFSKVTAVPQRVGISIPVTNEAMNDASFDLNGLVVEQMSKALARVINKAVVGTTAVGNLAGAFSGTNAKRKSVTFSAKYPTYAELVAMKGKILGAGVQMAGFAYVMGATTYATLEGTPITTGDSRMIIEGGKIAGYPVFITEDAKVADGTVLAGCFGYSALNQHGDIHFIVDPYTNAKKNETVFTLNTDISLTILKAEAFCIGKQ